MKLKEINNLPYFKNIPGPFHFYYDGELLEDDKSLKDQDIEDLSVIIITGDEFRGG